MIQWLRILLPMQGTWVGSQFRKIPHVTGQLSPSTATTEACTLKPSSATREATHEAHSLQLEKRLCSKKIIKHVLFLFSSMKLYLKLYQRLNLRISPLAPHSLSNSFASSGTHINSILSHSVLFNIISLFFCFLFLFVGYWDLSSLTRY